MNKYGIIFDLDGTLWNTTTQVVPAWNEVLATYKNVSKKITIEDMRGYMGKDLQEISEIMFPNLKPEIRMGILKKCCDNEQKYLRKHGGTLYPNLENTLKILSKKYSLYIVSNCQDGYLQAFLDYHKMNNYFHDIEMSGRTHLTKGANIKLIIKRNNITKAVYVGDTIGDMKAAEFAEIPFIYASYGFGNLATTEKSISSIEEILDIIL